MLFYLFCWIPNESAFCDSDCLLMYNSLVLICLVSMQISADVLKSGKSNPVAVEQAARNDS